MAWLHVHTNSKALRMPVPLEVLLPEYDPEGKHGTSVPGPYPSLYLLHGYDGNHTDWMLKTSLARYLKNVPLAVICPAGNNSFYVDTKFDQAYGEYIGQELPSLCEKLFDIDPRREKRFIAGLSMGGYGALRAALNYPESFSAVAAFSAAIDLTHLYTREQQGEKRPFPVKALLGEREEYEAGCNNLFNMLDRVDPAQAPTMLVTCGTEDGLFRDNERFLDAAVERKFPIVFKQSAGGHKWEYWDEMIKETLPWFVSLAKEGK